MVQLFWGFTGIIMALGVAALVVVLVAWAVIAIGLKTIEYAEENHINMKWLKRLYGEDDK